MRRKYVVTARDFLLKCDASLFGLINLPAVKDLGVPAAQRDAVRIYGMLMLLHC